MKLERKQEMDDNKRISDNKNSLFGGSEQIYVLKALAIGGVVTAHGTAVPDTFSYLSTVVSKIIQSIGSMGVGIFFCISGYLMFVGTSKKLKFSHFLMKKFKQIGIPWIISAVLVYLYVAIRKGGSIAAAVAFIIGYMSSYWYMSVLMILYFIFFIALRSAYYERFCYCAWLASIISIILRVMGIIPPSVLGVYLNIFNWSVFFALGILLAKVNIYDAFWTFLYRMRILIYLLVVLIVLVLGISKISLSYYSWFYIPVEFLVILSALFASRRLRESNVIVKIGMASFSIYLYEQLPWSGLIAHICDKYDFWILTMLRPVLIFLCTYFMVYIGFKIFQVIGKEKIYCKLTGFRI